MFLGVVYTPPDGSTIREETGSIPRAVGTVALLPIRENELVELSRIDIEYP